MGNIENGYNYPKLSALEKLSKALEYKITDFFNFEHLETEQNLIYEINLKLNNNLKKFRKYAKY